MAELTKEETGKDAAQTDLKKSEKKSPGWFVRLSSGEAVKPLEGELVAKRGPGRPKKIEGTPKDMVGVVPKKRGRPRGSKNASAVEGVVKRGPGRPKGSGKVKPGRPKGSGRKGKAGRPKGLERKIRSLKSYVKHREAKRMIKEAVKAYHAKLPKLITKEIKKLFAEIIKLKNA